MCLVDTHTLFVHHPRLPWRKPSHRGVCVCGSVCVCVCAWACCDVALPGSYVSISRVMLSVLRSTRSKTLPRLLPLLPGQCMHTYVASCRRHMNGTNSHRSFRSPIQQLREKRRLRYREGERRAVGPDGKCSEEEREDKEPAAAGNVGDLKVAQCAMCTHPPSVCSM